LTLKLRVWVRACNAELARLDVKDKKVVSSLNDCRVLLQPSFKEGVLAFELSENEVREPRKDKKDIYHDDPVPLSNEKVHSYGTADVADLMERGNVMDLGNGQLSTTSWDLPFLDLADVCQARCASRRHCVTVDLQRWTRDEDDYQDDEYEYEEHERKREGIAALQA
jgi:hypothetical protein